MAFDGLLVTEIFHSIQGETSLAGKRFAFIRLTGCNLRCTYCDTTYAFKGGTRMSLQEVLERIQSYGVTEVLLTGGEPLLQRNTVALIHLLRTQGYSVSIETHGEISIAAAAPYARIIMDIKTPGSKMNRMGFIQNIPFLKPEDEVKFVITSEADYQWAKAILQEHPLPVKEILFSPAFSIEGRTTPIPSTGSLPPEHQPGLGFRWLAESILRDQLPVRMQVQLHKIIWGPDQTGV